VRSNGRTDEFNPCPGTEQDGEHWPCPDERLVRAPWQRCHERHRAQQALNEEEIHV
jgi:hypothetical protein